MVQCNVIESTLNSGIDIPGHRSTDGRSSVNEKGPCMGRDFEKVLNWEGGSGILKIPGGIPKLGGWKITGGMDDWS